MRPICRITAWSKAYESLEDWQVAPIEQVAKAICRTATADGHFSIWMKVFEQHQAIRNLLVENFKGTEKKYFEEKQSTEVVSE